jgi:pimeloyl-ACP methyl ester carboxylesterase
MTVFTTSQHVIRDVRVAVLEAGSGAPLVFLHGAGTIGGFDFLAPLAKNRRLIVPIHPGFEGSADDPSIESAIDYVVHYASLFDRLGLSGQFDLVGHSFGGWISALFAVFQGHRIRRLALAAPAGLRVPAHPMLDIFTVPADEFGAYLVADLKTLAGLLPDGITNEMKVARYRETISFSRVAWLRNYEPKLERWLDRVTMPTLLLWGDQDRIVPVQQAGHWAERLAKAEIAVVKGSGHLLFPETGEAITRLQAFFDRPT